MSDADEYGEIVAGLERSEVAALWSAALSGRRIEPRLEGRLRALVTLRDQMGRASAIRRPVNP